MESRDTPGARAEDCFLAGSVGGAASSRGSLDPGMGLDVFELALCFHATLGVVERAWSEGDDEGSTPLTYTRVVILCRESFLAWLTGMPMSLWLDML